MFIDACLFPLTGADIPGGCAAIQKFGKFGAMGRKEINEFQERRC